MLEKLRLIRDEVAKRLAEVYNKNQHCRSRQVQFKERQIVYRKDFRLSSMAENYNGN